MDKKMDPQCLELLLLKLSRMNNIANFSLDTNVSDLDQQNDLCQSQWKELSDNIETDIKINETGRLFYAYMTPFIIVIGLVGNFLSLSVFTMKSMRKLSASIYLGALALSDSIVLSSYALLEWLFKGLPKWPGNYTVNMIGIDGICQTYLFVSYTFRFFSAYLITIFTVERYVGVCKPLHRRSICTNNFARRSIFGLLIIAAVISLYKPVLSSLHKVENTSVHVCGSKPSFNYVNFVLDSIYASLIIGLSIILIASMNILIIRKLYRTRKRHQQAGFHNDDNTGIKIQFTIIILLVSSTFVLLNLPYVVVWCLTYTSNYDQGLEITKTIFLCNYACNFFLYSVTGAYFRKQLRKRFDIFCTLCKMYQTCKAKGISKHEEEIYKEQSVVLTGCTLVHDTTVV